VEDALLALEAKEVDLLSSIRLRYTGQLMDLTTVYDDQDILHTDVQEVEKQAIDTTVGRVLFNDHLPEGVPFINGILKKKGLGQLVSYCYLRLGRRRRSRWWTRSRRWASTTPPGRRLHRDRRHGDPGQQGQAGGRGPP